VTVTNNGQVADVVEGVVENANERGIKVGGEWRTASKFYPVDLPDRGARVRIELDGKGFIRTLRILDAAPNASVSSSMSKTRDRTITRLAVLKAAANFLGLMGQAREEVKSDHELVLADRWLAWVEQPDQDQKEE